jgi:hypothetical protein
LFRTHGAPDEPPAPGTPRRRLTQLARGLGCTQLSCLSDTVVAEDTARLCEHLLAQRFWADHGHVDAIVEHPADKIGSHWYAHPETDAPIGQGVDLLARMPLLFGDPGSCRLRELEFDLLGRGVRSFGILPNSWSRTRAARNRTGRETVRGYLGGTRCGPP